MLRALSMELGQSAARVTEVDAQIAIIAEIGREVSDVLAAFLLTGRTTTSLTIPAVDGSDLRGGCRIVNVHRDVPGVLAEPAPSVVTMAFSSKISL